MRRLDVSTPSRQWPQECSPLFRKRQCRLDFLMVGRRQALLTVCLFVYEIQLLRFTSCRPLSLEREISPSTLSLKPTRLRGRQNAVGEEDISHNWADAGSCRKIYGSSHRFCF